MFPAPADTYSIAHPLSYSGRTVVYRGVRNADRRPVVLKVLDPRSGGPKELEQLKHEYEIGRLVDSPAIVKPLALQTFEGMPALVMEDFGGTSLDHLIDGPMAAERFLTLASRIAAAVAELHAEGLVHRDLKPENILVGPAGEVKLADLGMALLLGRGRSSPQRPSRIEGSLPYMAPEQTGRMNRSVDSRSDLYALGVTFYEMLTGQLPFQASDPLSWVHCHVARKPRPLEEIVPDIPLVLSGVVLKLLAKLAEDRYQTARGLQHDLEVCLIAWGERGKVEPFVLGQRDGSDRFEIPEQLCGRQAETAELVRAFERVLESGTPELAIVSGYSGIGKSSLVRELLRPLAQARGFFVSGKFDQYKRDVPYSTLSQAFAELIEQILTESKEHVAAWKTELQRALGTSGQLVVDVIPQLELIVGPQPALVPLPPVEAQNRFHMVFRQFVSVFAQKEHPLALFLDDLQWVDSGSLKLIEEIVLHPQTRYLLLLGAYRDNEVGPSHPLRLMLDKLQTTNALVCKIVLGPLGVEHLGQLIAASLHCGPQRAAPLARLVQRKTGGNPFFAIQFLTTLYQDGLLTFDGSTSEWRWEISKIEAKGFTDNVLDLMARKLSRIPSATRDALKLAACVGSRVDLHTLALISNQSHEETARCLSGAVSEGLLLQTGDAYAFLHDRVQQSAYALMGEGEKEEVHLEIGRLLLRSLEPRAVEERIFDVVTQLNRGALRMTDTEERNDLVRLDLIAARRAKASIAYASARNFLAVAAALLPADAWESRYDVVLPVFLERAECAYLCGAFEEAEALFEVLLARARTTLDKAAVYELRLQLYEISGKNDEALGMGISALRLLGVEIPEDDEAVDRALRVEREAIKARLSDRMIAALADAAEATDPTARAVIGLLSHLMPAAYFGCKLEIWHLVVAKLVSYSLEFGPTKDSCFGYASFGATLFESAPHVGYEFSEMAIALNQKLGDTSRRGTVLHVHGNHVNFWVKPIATDFPIVESAFLACIDAGDLVFAGCIAFELPWQAIERGDTIDDALVFSRKYAAFARDARIEAVHQTIRIEQQFLACLKGTTRGPTSFDDDSFEEKTSVATLGDAAFTTGIAFYHTMKLVAAYLAGDDALAVQHAEGARATLRAALALPLETTFYFFDALLLARIHSQRDLAEQRAILETLASHEKRLAFWARNCPENFLAKYALVSAEIARITGDELLAQRRYEEAIRSAHANGFVHWEAIANELAASFHRERDFETIADAYLRQALHCYVRWGAEAKVAQLEQRQPQLRRVTQLGPAGTFVGRAEHLDLLSIVKASQSISGVMAQDQLLRALLQLVLEEGGARRARLVLPRDGAFAIAAEAAVDMTPAEAAPPDGGESELASRVPLSVLLYVQRTGQRIVLDDAAIAGWFGGDPYFARVRPRAALCLPIRREPEVVALLYLENDLVPGAFTPERLLALDLLAAQAAISLENALLLERERGGRVEAERASERALLLAEATSMMSSTLDYKGLFAALTRLCVRSFADWAIIDLLHDGKVVRIASAHRDPAKEPVLRELSEHYPARLGTNAPAVSVLRDGKPKYLSAITDELIRATAVDAHHAELVMQVGTRSAIVVPLLARDTRLGALTLAAASPHRFGRADVELAVELGRRAAITIDNARLLRETQEALRLREEFLSLTSHELRTPLTSLRLTAEALLEVSGTCSALPPETVARCLRRIVRETERLQYLSEEVLDVMLIERGELSIRPGLVDLSSLVNGIVKRLESDLRAASCPVTVASDTAIVGMWDRARLEQVVMSMLSNAIKFGAGRPIDIRLREVDGIAKLVVEDQGIGIDEAKLPRVFERFERGVPLKHYGGLGLGLYITRWLVEAHSGSIHVQSELGVGSKFTVELPLNHAGEASPALTTSRCGPTGDLVESALGP